MKNEDRLLSSAFRKRTRVMVLNLKTINSEQVEERNFYSDGGKRLECNAQRGGRSLVGSGNISDQARQGREKSDLVEDVLIICREVELDDL